MRLLIACPVLRREWIIAAYLEHAQAAADRAGADARFLLVGGLGDPTFEVVDGLPQYDVMRVYVNEPRDVDVRDWPKPGRKERMVDLRNLILNQARSVRRDYLLSLDSDILLHPDAIANLVETQHNYGWAAVGGYCYMSSNRSHPSYAHLEGHAMRRPDIVGGVGRCDVLMAIKLMTSKAWNVDYVYDRAGEDIGWSREVKRAGLTVGVDARVVNWHVMRPAELARHDPRVTWS